MSFGGVDMQMAVHKNTEVGALQSQMQQKPTAEQQALAAGSARQTEEDRKRSGKVEESPAAVVGEKTEDGGKERPISGRTGRGKTAPEARAAKHPFKGHHIDITL